MKVRVNSTYRFDPVPWDTLDPPRGVQQGFLNKGDIVKVVNQHGCPKANLMGHCFIEKDGKFAGLVHTNSLQRK
jgi:hypothetical protein